MPSEPVLLSVEQIEALNKKLSSMRHDINNNLALIMAAAELIKFKPDTAERMMDTLNDQPLKITETLAKFSEEFEAALHIRKI